MSNALGQSQWTVTGTEDPPVLTDALTATKQEAADEITANKQWCLDRSQAMVAEIVNVHRRLGEELFALADGIALQTLLLISNGLKVTGTPA
jgi:hypothetical protein